MNTEKRNMMLALAFALAMAAGAAQAAAKPNILLILADDMGYSDVGCFGGEIKTPNIDTLAKRGMRATGFCTGPTCSPTRSMLLSGVDSHVAGLGNMGEFIRPPSSQVGKPGYEGQLNDRVVCMATVLRDAGYHTYMAGKWHMGEEKGVNWPVDRGFERDFTLMQGGGSNWDDMMYPNPAHPHLTFTLNGETLKHLPEGHFSSQAYSDFIMKSVDEHKDDGKPFFAYLSFQAVHSPFGVPDDWLNKYSGQYDAGYEAIRAARIARMKDMGLLAKAVVPSPKLPRIPAWDSLPADKKKLSARRMEIYAAMVENMDYHIGRVVSHLKEIGKLDNTLIIFFSDNGAEPTELAMLVEKVFSPEGKKWFLEKFDQRPENWGKKGSAVDYGAAWAQAGVGPFFLFKGFVAEGGIRCPLIIAGPGVNHAGDINKSFIHVMDIAPTLYELAGAEHPSTRPGSKIAPLQGKSLVPLLAGKAETVRGPTDWIGWELFGNRAVRQGDWKILNILRAAGGTGVWQLFNVANDPGETKDLAKENPAKLNELIAVWDQYEKKNGVLLTGDGPYNRPGNKTTIEEDLAD